MDSRRSQRTLDGGLFARAKIANELEVFLGVGIRWNRQRGELGPGTAQPNNPERPDRSPVIETYLKEHRERLAQVQQGIDYRSAMRRGQLTLSSLGSLIAKQLGQSGGLSSLTIHEQLTLETLLQKHPQVRSLHVQEAAKKASGEGFSSLLWHLQNLIEGDPT